MYAPLVWQSLMSEAPAPEGLNQKQVRRLKALGVEMDSDEADVCRFGVVSVRGSE